MSTPLEKNNLIPNLNSNNKNNFNKLNNIINGKDSGSTPTSPFVNNENNYINDVQYFGDNIQENFPMARIKLDYQEILEDRFTLFFK